MFSSFFSKHGSANETPLCFSINSPPFENNHTIAAAYFSAVFSGLGLSSNLFALVVLAKTFHHTKSRSRSSFLLFLGGLVFTDFMGLLVTGSIVVSFHITHFNWRELDPHCHFCNFMGMSMVFYGLCPLLLGAAMAIERFVGINRPFARTTNMSKSRALSTVAMVWVTAGCISLLPLGGLGSYHLQMPGSWCFLNISSKPLDMTFSLIFSLVGLLSLVVSFFLNTVSIAQTVLSGSKLEVRYLLLWLRFATGNQVMDPWVYILFRRSVLKWIYPSMDWSRGSIVSLYPSFSASLRKLTRASLGGMLGHLEHVRQIPDRSKQEDTPLSVQITSASSQSFSNLTN
ncbi:thromboxane A2 receptor-like isoform X2 [Xyrauchen texanus]|uniref:thromboxane A2 receptor-like isoform X2 n=1 Tax=Xyrauchen texanus TaxID=154827 RepID=UPI002242704F|nr:thromboxane A2 receptor-like isoform X2 [Xyrauchen texanus]